MSHILRVGVDSIRRLIAVHALAFAFVAALFCYPAYSATMISSVEVRALGSSAVIVAQIVDTAGLSKHDPVCGSSVVVVDVKKVVRGNLNLPKGRTTLPLCSPHAYSKSKRRDQLLSWAKTKKTLILFLEVLRHKENINLDTANFDEPIFKFNGPNMDLAFDTSEKLATCDLFAFGEDGMKLSTLSETVAAIELAERKAAEFRTGVKAKSVKFVKRAPICDALTCIYSEPSDCWPGEHLFIVPDWYKTARTMN